AIDKAYKIERVRLPSRTERYRLRHGCPQCKAYGHRSMCFTSRGAQDAVSNAGRHGPRSASACRIGTEARQRMFIPCRTQSLVRAIADPTTRKPFGIHSNHTKGENSVEGPEAGMGVVCVLVQPRADSLHTGHHQDECPAWHTKLCLLPPR